MYATRARVRVFYVMLSLRSNKSTIFFGADVVKWNRCTVNHKTVRQSIFTLLRQRNNISSLKRNIGYRRLTVFRVVNT